MLASLFNIFRHSRLLQLFIITGCIQGGVIISQFLITPWVAPSIVGGVRSLETLVALVVLAGGLGMQSIAIRDTAIAENHHRQTDVLRYIFLLVLVSSCVVVAGVFISYEFIFSSALVANLLTVCGLVFLTNLLRITTGFAQGAKAMGRIYLVLGIVTAFSVVLHVLLTKFYGLEGWMAARYLGELFCLAAVWWKLRDYVLPALNLAKVDRRTVVTTAVSGATINAGLFFRLFVDSLPILALTALHVTSEEVGFYGVAVLSIVFGLLPLAIIAQRSLPEFVGALDQKSELRIRFNALSSNMIKVSGVAAILLIGASVGWLLFVGGIYKVTALYIIVLALSLPMKAISLSCGTMLVALQVFGFGLKVCVVEGVIVLLILYFFIPLIGGWAGVLATLIGALISMLMFFTAVKARLADL